MFTDRIEVANPGRWMGKQIPDGRLTQFGHLRSDSRRPNFTLAKVMAWMRVVEGEGAGIPRAIGDCRNSGAPEPTMLQRDGVVTVTIYPRDDLQTNTVDPLIRGRDEPTTFDLGVKVADAWREFARALQNALQTLPSGSHLELTLDPTASGTVDAIYGVSLRRSDDGTTALAVGNAALPEGFRLDRSQIAQLVALGWSPPGVLAGSGESFGLSGNDDSMATIVTRTLRDVYGAPHPAFLVYTTRDSQDEPLTIAQLGSARHLSTMGDAIPAIESVSLAGLNLGERVRIVVAAMTKTDPDKLAVDGDGDIGIRAGSAMVFVRVHDNPRSLTSSRRSSQRWNLARSCSSNSLS